MGRLISAEILPEMFSAFEALDLVRVDGHPVVGSRRMGRELHATPSRAQEEVRARTPGVQTPTDFARVRPCPHAEGSREIRTSVDS